MRADTRVSVFCRVDSARLKGSCRAMQSITSRVSFPPARAGCRARAQLPLTQRRARRARRASFDVTWNSLPSTPSFHVTSSSPDLHRVEDLAAEHVQKTPARSRSHQHSIAPWPCAGIPRLSDENWTDATFSDCVLCFVSLLSSPSTRSHFHPSHLIASTFTTCSLLLPSLLSYQSS